MLTKQGMDYVKDITLKYLRLNRPKLKNLCNDVKMVIVANKIRRALILFTDYQGT